ncbi:2'-5' RNA ligase [Virgibacillus natechei]|uniref:Putative phosphoesterase J2Z83_001164 n=1 Tax=Virgibacillus natechei TaxID=1216297 RepID=A0ABS4IDQ0_9BACI|nr:YjcG family protein [Virgibacillus natechei]MBP1969061.1 2'-5' RNA ligase [Virgibacillus natechei]UZD14331.1 YjcG family protein [Virgibacillus natechei]
MKYGIAIFPSKSVQDEANSYRMRYDPRYDLIPPHITLKQPFEADDSTIDELVTELKQIANEFNPFMIHVNKVSTFAPVTNTIYLKVEPIQELIDLYDKMHQGKFPQNQEYSFVPHITIAQELPDDEYSDVFGSLKMRGTQYEDEIDRFQLLYQLDNGSWSVHETFVFGKEYV